MATKPTDQCIVLPFQPANPNSFDGSGLALHFPHRQCPGPARRPQGDVGSDGGWKRSFPGRRCSRITAAMLGSNWIWSRSAFPRRSVSGSMAAIRKNTVSMHLFDAQSPEKAAASMELPISVDDGLVRFRSQFIQWLAASGLAMEQAQAQAALVARNPWPARAWMPWDALWRFFTSTRPTEATAQ